MKLSNSDFLMLVVAFLVGYFFQGMTGIKLVEGNVPKATPCQEKYESCIPGDSDLDCCAGTGWCNEPQYGGGLQHTCTM